MSIKKAPLEETFKRMLTFWLICIVTVTTQNIATAEDVSGELKLVLHRSLNLI